VPNWQKQTVDQQDNNSVTQWLRSLRRGDERAAERLWRRYFEDLVRLAKQRLGCYPRRAVDEEDVALSVFETLTRGVAQGAFSRLSDRRDLWCLLLAITKQKVADLKRREGRQKRGSGHVRGDSVLGKNSVGAATMTLDDLCGSEPTPDFLAVLDEEHRHLLGLLRDDTLRDIATATLEGYTVSEVAARLKVTSRTIQRKICLIREKWAKVVR
jgi:DNA-directed RNA polymerase specialized sigma24 family protein